jgi:non-heme chloroperoxidase
MPHQKPLGTVCRRLIALSALLFGITLWISSAMSAELGTERSFSSSDNVRLHYHDSGSGRAIILIPGWTMPAWIFEHQVRALNRDFRVIAFDPRSQGNSQVALSGHHPDRRAKDIAELIEAIGESSVVLVGWSLGVLDSLAYIQQHGDRRVAALVLIDNSVGEEPPPESKYDFVGALKKDRNGTTRSFVRAMYKRPQSDQYYKRLADASLKTPLAAAIDLLSYPYPRTYWRDAIYSTARPILYAVTPAWAEQGKNLIRKHPSAQLEVFSQAGHALFVDESDRFNRVLGEFLLKIGVKAK